MNKVGREYMGEDSIDGTTIVPGGGGGVGSGPVVVDHNPPPPPPTTGYSPPASNSPPLPVYNAPPKLPVADVKLSQKSGIAPYETLFHDFELQAEPVYNFWEQDEESSSGFQQGNRDINDIPRYIQLWWNPAPDIKDPDLYRRNRLSGQDPNARSVFTKLSPFGFGSQEIVSSAQNGTLIVPTHMQPDNFQSNANNLANGHVFSGIIEATSEVKENMVGNLNNRSPSLIEEDDFLADISHAGLSFGAVNSALWNWKSSIFGLNVVMGGDQYLSPNAKLQKSYLFDGQFAMSAPSNTNGPGIRAANASSPGLSLTGRTSAGKVSTIAKIFETIPAAAPTSPVPVPVQAVKVKLLHTNLSNLYDSAHVNSMTEPHHAENAISIVPFVGNLVAYAAAGMQHYKRSVSIPGNPVAADLVKPLEYIGYVIEKFEQIDGSFRKVDTFYIPGREYDSINDAEIKYGATYRYRIRGVLRWSRPREVGILGKDTTVIPANISINITPYEVSYFGSEWGSTWAYARALDYQKPNPPDELMVRPISGYRDEVGSPTPAIEVTFKFPYNPQRDINKMTLWRKLVDENNVEVTDWIQIQEVNDELRQGTLLRVSTEYEHEQDDITGTKLHARENERVETFVEYAPSNSRYLDLDVKYNNKYVYAALCETRHGEVSALSDQLAARVNKYWQRDGEFTVEFVSCAGVDIDYDTGPFRVYPEIRDRTEIIFNTRFDREKHEWIPATIGFTGQDRLAQKMLNGNNYIARIESLDNGQHVDIPVNLSINNQPEQYQETRNMPLFNFGSWGGAQDTNNG
jgi:hypothetical protein